MCALRTTRTPRQLQRPGKVTPARWAAWHVVRRTFEDDAWTDRSLAAEAERAGLDPRDRAHAQRLSYGAVQLARRCDYLIARAGRRPLRKIDAPVLHALRLGVFELLDADDVADAHAAVDQAVEIVRAVVGERAVAFANAVLRRVQADAETWLAELDARDDEDLATTLSFPQWMVAALRREFGQDGVDALAAQNSGSPASFRINTLMVDEGQVDAALRELEVVAAGAGGTFRGSLPEARVVEGSSAPAGDLVERGWLVPQSLASMVVARALDPAPGESVLDMCAAPGGKTTHMAALMAGEGSIVACELHEHRAESVARLVERCGAAAMVTMRTVDATTIATEHDGAFDRVLLDAPCTGTGVLARRPDARWRHGEDDLEGLLDLQRRLLAAAARVLRPGGVLVYSTCSLLREEDESQVEHAVGDLGLVPDPLPGGVPEWLHLPGAPHLARTWPHVHRTEGFFIARLRRPGGEGA